MVTLKKMGRKRDGGFHLRLRFDQKTHARGSLRFRAALESVAVNLCLLAG
ncbi:MAG: hypothetical protein ACI9R3_004738 [Verrucomicrobiales bacterium]|jgi:hypothetical protein